LRSAVIHRTALRCLCGTIYLDRSGLPSTDCLDDLRELHLGPIAALALIGGFHEGEEF
jgi:hypothetical protein